MGVTAVAFQIASDAVAQNARTHAAIFPVKDGPGFAADRLWSLRHSRRLLRDDSSSIQIDLGVALHCKELVRRISRWAAQHPDDRHLIVVDSLDGMHGVDLRRQSGHRVVAELADLAHELGAIVLLCANLKARPRYDNERPAFSELDQYGPILDDCAQTFLLHRDAYFHRRSRDPTGAQLYTWTWRHGHYCIGLDWDEETGAFESISP